MPPHQGTHRPRRPPPLDAAFQPPPLFTPAGSSDWQPPPSPRVLHGLVVRLKYAGAYHLLPVEGFAAAAGGTHGLSVQHPEGGPEAPLLHVPISSVSDTSCLADDQWETAGRAEVAQLAALLQRRGLGWPVQQVRCRGVPCPVCMQAHKSWTDALLCTQMRIIALMCLVPSANVQVAAAAWRKKAALEWYAQHGAQPRAEQQQHLPALLQQLDDAAGIAGMQQQLELHLPPPQEQRQPQDPALMTTPPAGGPGQAVAPQASPHPSQPPGVNAEVSSILAMHSGAMSGTAVDLGSGGLCGPSDWQAAPRPPAAGLHTPAALGSSNVPDAAVVGIQRQLDELRQLLTRQQQQPQQAQQEVEVGSQWEVGRHQAAYSSPAWQQQGAIDPRISSHQLPALPHTSFAHRATPFTQPYGSPPFQQQANRHVGGDAGGGGCIVRLPGNPPLASAHRILSVTIRRAVPSSEQACHAKRAALTALLHCGLSSCAVDTFKQRPLALRELGPEIGQVRVCTWRLFLEAPPRQKSQQEAALACAQPARPILPVHGLDLCRPCLPLGHLPLFGAGLERQPGEAGSCRLPEPAQHAGRSGGPSLGGGCQRQPGAARAAAGAAAGGPLGGGVRPA